ncbi:S49 family peptidase [Gordonia jinhuaensis]|uniref:Serine protease n=1 Tax=Gordonia jinhuaensis TaxID=1517702 RepID=A0A916TFW1_9ACTN|nr:S49 family peptidase [Gordonia jinhuaensis]GGB43281.1 serine protease [Gordonia jinhuaensis]
MTSRPLKKILTSIARARADRIAVVRLDGVIGGLGPGRNGMTIDRLEPVLRRAFELDRLKAVALVVNSPGGSPSQSEYIAGRIRQLATEKGVRVLAFCEDVAASGGYWLACAADEIFVANTSVVGSIGVISSSFGLEKVIDRFGIERRVHTAGENKHRLDVFQAEQPEDVAWLEGLQGDIHAAFISWVRRRRGARLAGDDAELFNGDVWVGRRAVDLGLADGVGMLRSVIAERYPDAEIEPIAAPKPLLARLTSSSRLTEGVVTGVIDAAEARAAWSRYGR